jgi:hypothetical protein
MSKSQGMALNHLMHLNCLLFNVKFRTLYYQKKTMSIYLPTRKLIDMN